MRDQKQVCMKQIEVLLCMNTIIGQGTSNSYSEYRVNNVSDRNYNLQYEHPVTSITGTNSSGSHPDEPKFRLPYYNGKSDFQSFWSVFEIGVRKFNWDNSKQVEQLMCCLKDDALAYVSKLPSDVRRSIKHTYELLERRYGDHLLPEQYREKLNQVRKEYKESLTEYAARVDDLVYKAFPGLNPPELLVTLTIENLLRGLPDQSLAYEVRTKSPNSVDEAIKLITWHECCKNSGKKTSSVGQLEIEETEEYTDLEVRKVNGGRPRFVTEEQLESRLGVFAKEIQHDIKDGHSQLRNDFKDEIGKLSTAIKGDYPNKNAGYKKQNDSLKFSLKDTTCFTCQRKGHIKIVDTDLDTAMVDVVIDRVRSVTLRAPLSIEGEKVKAVVDTGPEVVMSESLFFKIPEAKRPSLQESKRNLVVAETGKRMKTLGVAKVSVEIGPLKLLWSIYVAPISDDLLLGCDVIDEKDITINTKRGLEIQGVWIDCDVQRRSNNVPRILSKETVTIPPNSEVILGHLGVNCETIHTRSGSIEPVMEDERKILVTRCGSFLGKKSC
ncbi:Hypothetical predicted protein [Mytilus galloprovincialis]|uniref:Peptidase A2 domain-containing protein n=1 Tax=Mytilus galloprovincialis TaxID=29158 RepID=A0A8B6GGK4_MYTGA|nr:Hypothetical predicted protein [Mytilus galloprovincialis]